MALVVGGLLYIALIKEQVAAGIHSHLRPCSGPCSGPCRGWIAIALTQERSKTMRIVCVYLHT